MKKIVLSIAAVMAAAAFAPEASAVPVFARQTGMACSACHFQHFPLLNGFGRAFKSAGFTMMGAQGKVEGEHLDIPANLNFGVLTTTGYETVSGSVANIKGGNKAWFVPASGGELSLFMGGRISEFAGFLTETGLGKAASTGAAKLAMMFPVGDNRVGLVAHTSNGQGVAYSYENLNTGAVNTHKMTALNGNNQGAASTQINGGHTGVYSAAQYLNTNTAATGLSFVASNDNLGYINIGKYDMAGVGTATAGSLPLTYVRAVGLFNAAGWDMGAGVQSFSGTSQVTGNAAAIAGALGGIRAAGNIVAGNVGGAAAVAAAIGNTPIVAKATVLDFQAQGEVAGMGLGVYASYGTSPASVGQVNAFNIGGQKRTAFGIGAELGVIPGIATVQLAMRSAKSGISSVAVAGSNMTDNAIQVGATYELAQNVELSLTHSAQSGGAWDAANYAAGTVMTGKTMTSLMMEALF